MDWVEAGVGIIIAVQGANTLFLWSLHEKVTELIAQRESCAFCQSDTSTLELERMRRGLKG